MRLSAVLELPELKKREITVIGCYTTSYGTFAVLARRGEKAIPYPKLSYLIDDGADNPDPEVDRHEIDSILRKFGFFEAISTFSAGLPPKSK